MEIVVLLFAGVYKGTFFTLLFSINIANVKERNKNRTVFDEQSEYVFARLFIDKTHLKRADTTKNQSGLKVNACRRHQAWENACKEVTSDWLRKWRVQPNMLQNQSLNGLRTTNSWQTVGDK